VEGRALGREGCLGWDSNQLRIMKFQKVQQNGRIMHIKYLERERGGEKKRKRKEGKEGGGGREGGREKGRGRERSSIFKCEKQITWEKTF
jgi:hypothetical protein